MPDIYTLDANVSKSDFVTAVSAEQGYPVYWGRTIAWLNQFKDLHDVARWLSTVALEALESIADLIHPDFFPSDSFMEDLQFPDSNLFPLPDDAIYIEFDRYAAFGRAMVAGMITLFIRYGGLKLLMQLGEAWIQSYLRGAKFDELHDRLDAIDARDEITRQDGNIDKSQFKEDSIRLANIERYIHLLGESLRTNSRRNNDDLEFRATGKTVVAVPEWPEV